MNTMIPIVTLMVALVVNGAAACSCDNPNPLASLTSFHTLLCDSQFASVIEVLSGMLNDIDGDYYKVDVVNACAYHKKGHKKTNRLRLDSFCPPSQTLEANETYLILAQGDSYGGKTARFMQCDFVKKWDDFEDQNMALALDFLKFCSNNKNCP